MAPGNNLSVVPLLLLAVPLGARTVSGAFETQRTFDREDRAWRDTNASRSNSRGECEVEKMWRTCAM